MAEESSRNVDRGSDQNTAPDNIDKGEKGSASAFIDEV